MIPADLIAVLLGVVGALLWERRRTQRPSSFRHLKRLNQQHTGRDLRGRWT